VVFFSNLAIEAGCSAGLGHLGHAGDALDELAWVRVAVLYGTHGGVEVQACKDAQPQARACISKCRSRL
jgi:hypothetical protein